MDATAFLNGAAPEPEEKPEPPREDPPRIQLPAVIGRPTDYTEAVAHTICERIAEGQTIRNICKDKQMPARSTVFEWLIKHEAFARAYAISKDCRIEDIFDETLEIADGDYSVELKDEDGTVTGRITDKAAITQAKLRIETRFKIAASLAPRKYAGDIGPPKNPADNAKVIDGDAIPIEEHPFYASIQAWGRASRGEK